jgi:hypothetical protein
LDTVADELSLPSTGTSWSTAGLPLPDPHQQVWGKQSRTTQTAGYTLVHDMESLLTYYEEFPGVVVSYAAAPLGGMPFGAVWLVLGGRLFVVSIRDAGTARHLEMTAETDNARVEASVLKMRSTPLPAGVEVRVDRRRG